MKTITIHQNNGDDVLEMTVEVTNKEYAMMEKIRKNDPSAWEAKEFDLLKLAKDSITEGNRNKKRSFNWKVVSIIIITIAAIITVVALFNRNDDISDNPNNIFEEKSYKNEENIKKVYNKLAEWGADGTYKSFLSYIVDKSNRLEVYDLCKFKGYNGTYEQFLKYTGYDILETNENFYNLFNALNVRGAINCSCRQFEQWLLIPENRAALYAKLDDVCRMDFESQDYFYSKWLGLDLNKRIKPSRGMAEYVDLDKIDDKKTSSKINENYKTYLSQQYGFSYQYNNKDYQLVDRINKNSHCVMKLQSPSDAMKSILISVWEDVGFSTAYDSDFIDRVKQQDRELDGSVISSAVKTKVGGKSALKSELKISPMGSSYYTANYRIIEKNRMYQISIYIPFKEYNNDKTYADRCVEHFKFN